MTEEKIKENICCGFLKNGKHCNKKATKKAITILGELYYCTSCANKRRGNICVAKIEKI